MKSNRSKPAARQADPVADPFASPDRFYNRELSWLQFNRRVYEEAANARHPLLERVRFLSISASNLDEFYMVRVAGLYEQVAAAVTVRSADGLTPADQLVRINEMVGTLTSDQQSLWRALRAKLAETGLTIVEPAELSTEDRRFLEAHFMAEVFPLLTPLAVDPAHPFPFIPSLGFAVVLDLIRRDDGKMMHALLPIPQPTPGKIVAPVPTGGANKTVAIGGSGDVVMGWLLGLNGPYKDQKFVLKARIVIGTAPDCDIVLQDGYASSRHAEIRQAEGGFMMLDLGSTNGLLVNDKRVKEHFLVDNDAFRVGRTEFKFKSITG